MSEARERLTSTVRNYRNGVDRDQPLVFGSHRRAEAVILSFETYERLREGAESGSLLESVLSRTNLIRRVAALNKIAGVSIFGSVARGQETPDSDLDLLVEPMDGATNFDLVQFQIDMEQLFQRPVDVLPKGALDPTRDEQIMDEAVKV